MRRDWRTCGSQVGQMPVVVPVRPPVVLGSALTPGGAGLDRLLLPNYLERPGSSTIHAPWFNNRLTTSGSCIRRALRGPAARDRPSRPSPDRPVPAPSHRIRRSDPRASAVHEASAGRRSLRSSGSPRPSSPNAVRPRREYPTRPDGSPVGIPARPVEPERPVAGKPGTRRTSRAAG